MHYLEAVASPRWSGKTWPPNVLDALLCLKPSLLCIVIILKRTKVKHWGRFPNGITPGRILRERIPPHPWSWSLCLHHSQSTYCNCAVHGMIMKLGCRLLTEMAESNMAHVSSNVCLPPMTYVISLKKQTIHKKDWKNINTMCKY